MSGYLINDDILLAIDIEAAKESARLDAEGCTQGSILGGK